MPADRRRKIIFAAGAVRAEAEFAALVRDPEAFVKVNTASDSDEG